MKFFLLGTDKGNHIPYSINKNRIAKLFGTCYCLMKPVIEWTNPICVENLAGLHEDNFTAAGAGRILDEPTYCPIQEHHKMMEWDTVNGKREGLTMEVEDNRLNMETSLLVCIQRED